MKAWIVNWAPPLLVLALLVGGWEALARFGSVEDYLLPAPSDVARALVDDRDLLLPDAWVTLRGGAVRVRARARRRARARPRSCTSPPSPGGPCIRSSSGRRRSR